MAVMRKELAAGVYDGALKSNEKARQAATLLGWREIKEGAGRRREEVPMEGISEEEPHKEGVESKGTAKHKRRRGGEKGAEEGQDVQQENQGVTKKRKRDTLRDEVT